MICRREIFLAAALLTWLALSACVQEKAIRMTTFPASQAAHLEGLDFAAVVPSFVPEGFTVASVKARGAGGRRAAFHRSYRIVYDGPDGACFAVEGTRDGGFGGPVPAHRRSFEMPVFVEETNRQPFVYWSERPAPGFPAPTLFSDWIEEDRAFYRVVSGRHVSRSCRRIAPDAAARIAASLRHLDAIIAPPRALRLHTADAAMLSVAHPPAPRPGGTPRSMARRTLEALGLALPSEDQTGQQAVEQHLTTFRVAPDTAQVLVTRTGGGDDAVAGQRYLIELARAPEGGWQLLGVGRQVRCHRGRGHQDWSGRRCM